VTLILILALVLLASSVALVVHALVRPRTAAGMVSQIGRYGFAGEPDVLREEEDRSLDRVATSIGKYLGRRLSWFREEDLRRRLVSAGYYTVTPARFLGYQAIVTSIFVLFTVWLGAQAGWSIIGMIIAVAVAAALGWLGPFGIIQLQTRRRREEIEHQLPELIDFLIVAIEAGVSLSGALRLASNQIHGPLGEEMRLSLQEHNMGLSTAQTLENLAERADTSGMRIFARSIVQGEALGISIGQVMRNLAVEMRKRRRSSAEERAQKAPVKMVFPLVLLIFPPMLVILIVPAIVSIMRAL
jgi:tight adherence protein C